MKIYLATDHAGFQLKEKIKNYLQREGYNVEDCGALSLDPEDDYPDFISKAAACISENPQEKAIILGGSGQGEAMVANKYPGVRAAVYYGNLEQMPLLTREHNDSNVLSLGARFIEEEDALRAVKLFLETPFTNEERHVRRIEKIREIENGVCKWYK